MWIAAELAPFQVPASGMPVFLVKDKIGDIEDDMQWYEMAYEIIMSSVIRKIFGYLMLYYRRWTNYSVMWGLIRTHCKDPFIDSGF